MTAASSGCSTLMATLRSCLQVLGEVDGGHAALAELALDAVAVGEGGGETVDGRHVVKRSRATNCSPAIRRSPSGSRWRAACPGQRGGADEHVVRSDDGAASGEVGPELGVPSRLDQAEGQDRERVQQSFDEGQPPAGYPGIAAR